MAENCGAVCYMLLLLLQLSLNSAVQLATQEIRFCSYALAGYGWWWCCWQQQLAPAAACCHLPAAEQLWHGWTNWQVAVQPATIFCVKLCNASCSSSAAWHAGYACFQSTPQLERGSSCCGRTTPNSGAQGTGIAVCLSLWADKVRRIAHVDANLHSASSRQHSEHTNSAMRFTEPCRTTCLSYASSVGQACSSCLQVIQLTCLLLSVPLAQLMHEAARA
jgi:hypothetical protein